MKIPKYDPQDLAADIVVRHFAHLTGDIIVDITTAISEAFGDGYCRGFNDATEWWVDQDTDQGWLESFNEAVDEDELFTDEDLHFWDNMSDKDMEALDSYLRVLEKPKDDDDLNLPPGNPFDRRGGDE
jgi:hypothetical protein